MKSLTLFDLDQNYINIVTKIEEAGGELTPELEAEYDEVCDALIKKSGAYLSMDKYFDSQIDAGKEVIKRLSAKVKAIENRKNNLKSRLLSHMMITETHEIITDLGKIKLQKLQKVIDLPVTEYPSEYQKQKITVSVDKAQLKRDAKENEDLQKYIEDSYFIKIY